MQQSVDNPTGRIARNTLALYFRMFLVMGVSLYTSRVCLAELGVVDYGIYNVVGGLVVMLSFLNSAMAQSSQRFMSFEIGRRDDDRLMKTFRSALTIHILIGAVVLILAETLGLWVLNSVLNIPESQKEAANWVYQCSVAAFIFSIFQVPLNATIIARERMQIYAWLSIVDAGLKLGVACSLSLFDGDRLKYYSIMMLGATLICCLVNSLYCSRKFPECRFGLNFDRNLLYPMAKFATWSTLGSCAWVFRAQGCNLILNLFFGPAVNAAYAIATKVNVTVNSFVQNFNTALNPQIVKNYSAGNIAGMEQLIIHGAKLSFFLMLLVSYPLLLITGDVLNLWLTELPPYTVVFTQLVIINSLLESLIHNVAAGVNATGRIKWYQIIVSTSILLNIPLSYIALRLGYPPQAIFVISIGLTLFINVERVLILKHTVPQFSLGGFARVIVGPALAVIAGALGFYLFVYPLLSTLNPIVIALSSASFILLLEIAIGFDSSERSRLCTFIRTNASRRLSLRF